MSSPVIRDVINADELDLDALEQIKRDLEFPCAVCGKSFGKHSIGMLKACFQSFGNLIEKESGDGSGSKRQRDS